MSSINAALPTLISGANDLVAQMKADPSTNSKITNLLGKANTAINSFQKLGLRNSVAQAASILKTLPLDSSHPLAEHADVAKCGLEFAQKYLDLVAKKP